MQANGSTPLYLKLSIYLLIMHSRVQSSYVASYTGARANGTAHAQSKFRAKTKSKVGPKKKFARTGSSFGGFAASAHVIVPELI